jgi:hypothetical protein
VVAALEWEWSALHRGDEDITEFEKLKTHCTEEAFRGICFACLIGYARGGNTPRDRDDYTTRSAAVLDGYMQRWPGELPPLLLVVVHFELKGRQAGRRFVKMTIDQIVGGRRTRLREQPAYPWEVCGSRWAQEGRSSG